MKEVKYRRHQIIWSHWKTKTLDCVDRCAISAFQHAVIQENFAVSKYVDSVDRSVFLPKPGKSLTKKLILSPLSKMSEQILLSERVLDRISTSTTPLKKLE